MVTIVSKDRLCLTSNPVFDYLLSSSDLFITFFFRKSLKPQVPHSARLTWTPAYGPDTVQGNDWSDQKICLFEISHHSTSIAWYITGFFRQNPFFLHFGRWSCDLFFTTLWPNSGKGLNDDHMVISLMFFFPEIFECHYTDKKRHVYECL